MLNNMDLTLTVVGQTSENKIVKTEILKALSSVNVSTDFQKLAADLKAFLTGTILAGLIGLATKEKLKIEWFRSNLRKWIQKM